MYGSEAWCLKESKMGLLQRAERSLVRAMCGVQCNNSNRVGDLTVMLGLNGTIHQLAMAKCVC